MAFLYPFNQGASSSRGRSASTPSTNYENSPFGSDDAVAASPSRSSRSSLLSDWTSNELTEMEIDPPSRGTPTPQVIIDLTVDDDPPAAQYTAARPAQVQGGGYPRPGTHTSRELDNIYTMISRLQQDQRTHGEGIQGLSTRMGISENNIKGIGEDVQQLSTRMGIAESEFKGVHEGICKLSTRRDNFETRLKEDARNRQKERREDQKHHYRVERNHDIRHGIVIGMLKQRLDLVNQAIGSAGFGSPTSYKYDVPSSDSSQHTHSSSNSSLHQSPSRRAGYEDPRNSKGGRGGRVNDCLRRTRRQCTPSTRSGTPNSTTTGSVSSSSARTSPGANAKETANDIKSELKPPATSSSSQRSPSLRRETTARVTRSSDRRQEKQSSRTN